MKPNIAILIVGPAASGKTTARKHIASVLSIKTSGSCSDVIYSNLAELRNVSVRMLHELPKEEIRPELIRLGDEITANNPAAFAADMALEASISESDGESRDFVLDGIRRCQSGELNACKMHLAYSGYKVCVIELVRDDCPVDNYEAPSIQDVYATIINDGTVEDLKNNISRAVYSFLSEVY